MPRGQRRAAQHSAAASRAIPDKLYFRIGEVSALADTKPYVLRYWETEFPILRPIKSRSGHRLYRRQDVETVFEIRRLLYGQGFTIEGARRQLAGNSHGQASAEQKRAVRSAVETQQLKALKQELQEILTLLSRKC